VVEKIDALIADVSPRRYYRIHHGSGPIPTSLLMELSDSHSPVGGGNRALSQSDCFVEVAAYLREHGVRVPAIYVDAREEGYLLIEDLGERLFASVLDDLLNRGFEPLTDRITDSDRVVPQVEKGLDLLFCLQKLPHDEDSVVFQRTPDFQLLRKGGEEFIEFIVSPLSVGTRQLKVFQEAFDNLSEEVLSHPKVFSHYDFTSHNILVLPGSEGLALIDFQDACLESPARDLHALLCDRGMDERLGKERLAKMFEYYHHRCGVLDISQLYSEYSVLWDTRVSGRFTKLVQVDERQKYAAWIPGTMARVVRGFERLSKKFQRFGDCLDILLPKYPNAKEWVKDKWPYL
ncbi:MAG: phosphotransferase, partial [Bdellovibrionales bacterium]|nr:phosphotransferase [Bdellovibrionales bacterium]